MRWIVLALALAACGPKRASGTAAPPADDPALYRVGVVAATGDRTVTAVYSLEVNPHTDGVWTVRTRATEGAWEEGKQALSFDSTVPSPTDPWPLTLQHAIASVPAQVAIDETGRPVGLRDLPTWRQAASAAANATDLPPGADATRDQLLDPAGYLSDLQRTFPGLPPADGPWVRVERIAGVLVRRTETCTPGQTVGRTRSWTCEGHLEVHRPPDLTIQAGQSTTTLKVDRDGLAELTTTWAGTLVRTAPGSGKTLSRVAFAGQRMVVRG